MNRILIVEDDPAVLRGLRDNFAFESYEVVTAANGEDAHRLIHDLRPDVILMDVMLPVMWGDDLCKRVRSEGVTTPIVMLTARNDEAQRIDAFDNGADDYVSKPFAIRELNARVRSLLRSRRDLIAEHERLSRDLRAAAEVQRRLFPQAPPAVLSLECHGVCRPAQAVGGDYFDYFDIGHGLTGLLVADIEGKGLAAALRMASVYGHIRATARRCGIRVGEVFATVNQFLCRECIYARYATLFYGVYENANRTLHYVNGGHPAPLVFGNGKERCLAATVPPAGLFENLAPGSETLRLASGDTILACSDGVLEATNAAGEEFGRERLAALLADSGGAPAERICEAVLHTLETFSMAAVAPPDDITVLAARVR